MDISKISLPSLSREPGWISAQFHLTSIYSVSIMSLSHHTHRSTLKSQRQIYLVGEIAFSIESIVPYY